MTQLTTSLSDADWPEALFVLNESCLDYSQCDKCAHGVS